MSDARLKERIQSALWEVVDRQSCVLSATLTGSFVDSPSLEGISDIDFVVIVDHLDKSRFDGLLADFEATLRPALAEFSYGLRINPTLGPLKFNDPQTAVLHLMLYSHAGHIDHVVKSPFTCLDWERSPHHRKRSLAEVFPTFGLQPGHFLGARRSMTDYLKEFRAGVVSYRELDCTETGATEIRRQKEMTLRDRHEFAFHILKFLMQNLLKLARHENTTLKGEPLLTAFFELFPDQAEPTAALYRDLGRMKQACDFAEGMSDLDTRLETFLKCFESQFRAAFITDSVRHVAFRHARTSANSGPGEPVRFLGRQDPAILPGIVAPDSLRRAAQPDHLRVLSSPLARCLQSAQLVAPASHIESDSRLLEIDYGRVDGLTVDQARAQHPELFAAWERGEDPPFPAGESSADVRDRVRSFTDEAWAPGQSPSLVSTHNVVLRELVGTTLGVPPTLRHLIEIPHLYPIAFTRTPRFGLYLDAGEDDLRVLFAKFSNLR
jgi:ribonuclease H / adenosylcobalamin/alpha-ribazole phosphatase